MPASSVIKWVETLAAKGVKHVYFTDDTFNVHDAWFDEICHGLIKTGLSEKMLFKGMFRADLTTSPHRSRCAATVDIARGVRG